MKKIISLLLCLVLAAFTFVGCRRDRIGDELDDSLKGYVKESLTLNFYIVGDTTNDNATVNARINNYTEKKFNTSLNIVYCNESDYQSTVISALTAAKAAIESGASDEASLNAIKNKPDFFLINSPEMMKLLYEEGHLADLTEFFYPEIYEKRVEIYPDQENTFHAEIIKDCEGFHNQIAETLLDASVIYEDSIDPTTQNTVTNAKHYCVPNNRVIGSYEYLLIHRDTAETIGYQGSAAQLAAFTTYESTKELRDAIEAKNLNVEDYVRVVRGKYEDKAMYESGTYPSDDKKYACNILSYPEIAGMPADGVTIPAGVDNVFNSVLAVNKHSDADRAMEIIYAINTDDIFHNYLQYGVQDTNYTIDAETGLVDYKQINTAENKYFMNPIYTGDVFKILPSQNWTEADKLNGDKQNDESRIYKAS